MTRSSFIILIAAAVIFVGLIHSSEALFGKSIHCKWHNSLTRPFCGAAPKCASDKKLIPGTEKKCGKNKIHCCATGNMMVCCPKSWQGKNPSDQKATAAEAMAIAIND